jgi:hypothetical protein
MTLFSISVKYKIVRLKPGYFFKKGLKDMKKSETLIFNVSYTHLKRSRNLELRLHGAGAERNIFCSTTKPSWMKNLKKKLLLEWRIRR